MKALVIDPTPFQRRVLARLLAEEGFEEVVESSTAPESAAGDAEKYRAIFADVSIEPGALREAGWIVTGPENSDEALAARISEGARAFMTKPFTQPGLRQALADAELATGPSRTEPSR